MPISPSATVESINNEVSGQPEQSYVECVADVGEYEIFTATFTTYAGSAQGDYISFTEPSSGEKFAVWLDKNNNGTAPSGAVYTAADQKCEVDIAIADTASQVGQKVKTALALVAALDCFVISGSGAVLTFTANKIGTATDAAPHNTGDTGDGSITTSVTQQGVASNLLNKYFTLKNGADAAYFAWMNVNSQGVNPAPGGTAIEVTVAKGATAAEVATAVATAVDASAEFEAETDGTRVKITNSAVGTATNTGAGNSTFTVSVQSDGTAATQPGPSTAVSGLTNF